MGLFLITREETALFVKSACGLYPLHSMPTAIACMSIHLLPESLSTDGMSMHGRVGDGRRMIGNNCDFGGETEREMCPRTFFIDVLVIRCPTHIILVHMC
jgi:hypothetical protein